MAANKEALHDGATWVVVAKALNLMRPKRRALPKEPCPEEHATSEVPAQARDEADDSEDGSTSTDATDSRRIGFLIGTSLTFAVGMRITVHPPHRSEQARFAHSAPTSGI